jgi:glycerophosphoryl diester phosphodiesterase
MRRRAERLLLLAALLLVAAVAIRPLLGPARWTILGLRELTRLPAAGLQDLPRAPARIAHGGGALDGLHTPNTLEALDRNHARGVRWFEMDFLPDAGGAWWAVHDWPAADALRARGSRVPRLAEVLDWFGRNPDSRLVTDTKGDNGALLAVLQQAPAEVRARIHPQLYRFEEYGRARAGGFAAPIFTTYRSAYPWWLVRRFVERAPVLAVTVTRAEAWEACAALCGRVPVLTHTVNDPSDAARLAHAGLAGVYTDELLP